MVSNQDIFEIIKILDNNFRSQDYKGWDLYDALLSPLFNSGSIFDISLLRYVWTQINKRGPVNLRPLMGVPKSHNPKGLSLILRGYCLLYSITNNSKYLEYSKEVIELLFNLKSESKYYCWGNNFPYQSRRGYYRAYSPNAITTSFVVNALIDYYQISHDPNILSVISSVGEYYVDELLYIDKYNNVLFNYYKSDNYVTYNSNAKISESLIRISLIINNPDYKELVKNNYYYLLSKQNKDGSWFYNDSPSGKWIDNFHTGYVLVALKNIKEGLDIHNGDNEIALGLSYHIKNHFTEDWLPKYYNNSLYPIDIHCFAQAIITFIEFHEFEIASSLINNAIKLMYNKKKGFFIYSIRKYYKNRTNLLRWCNAYIFYAMSLYLSKIT